MIDGSDANMRAPAATEEGELDFRAVGQALWRKKFWVIVPALIVAAIAFLAVNLITPRYRSEARVLFDGRESVFFRPDADKAADRGGGVADQEAITSQVQLVLSRDLARQVIKELKLNTLPEFDPVLRGINPLRQMLAMVGLARDPLSFTSEERVFDTYYDRVTAFQVEKSRVIAIEFSSSDPELAARGANAVAAAYLRLQQAEKQEQTRAASKWLAGEIDKLRGKVADAEKKANDFRSRENLFFGSNNTPLSTQQLGELSSQLAVARAQKADLDARAQAIRAMLQSGRPIESSDVVNSELIRRLNEQRVTLRAQLAEQSSTLLELHPRIKELKAQIADLERQIRIEAERLVRASENDAQIAAARVAQLGGAVNQLKRLAASNSGQDVELRALEREAKAQRDLLESYLAKYREASARETLGDAPADARVISRAIVSNTPYYPKKAPIVLIAAFATLILAAAFITTGELLTTTPEAPPVIEDQPAVARKTDADAAAAAEEPAPSLVPEWAPAAENSMPVDGEHGVAATVALLNQKGHSRTIIVSLDAKARAAGPAIVLARELAANGRAILVDLALSEPHVGAITDEPDAPGMFDLLRGKALFGQVIARDRISRLHLIAAGEVETDGAALLHCERLSVALDALAHTYDHVVIDVGALREVPLGMLAAFASEAILAVEGAPEDARSIEAVELLRSVGFAAPRVFVAATGPAARSAGESEPKTAKASAHSESAAA
jgi:uncharacterized protein involved in exopolysaccharide biosynthesis